MKSLDLLRASTGFLDAVASSTAMQPFEHVLRCLMDPRPLTERIYDAVCQCAVVPSTLHSECARVGRVRSKIETTLPTLPILDVPDDKTIRASLLRMDEKKREF